MINVLSTFQSLAQGSGIAAFIANPKALIMVAVACLLLYLAFISAAAYSVWAMLLKANPVSKVAVFGFTNPMFGVLLSAVLLHEWDQINGSFVIALVLVCAGIITVNLAPHHPAAGAAEKS